MDAVGKSSGITCEWNDNDYSMSWEEIRCLTSETYYNSPFLLFSADDIIQIILCACCIQFIMEFGWKVLWDCAQRGVLRLHVQIQLPGIFLRLILVSLYKMKTR